MTVPFRPDNPFAPKERQFRPENPFAGGKGAGGPIPPDVGMGEGVALSAAQGASLGFADEGIGAAEAFSPIGLGKAIMSGENPIDKYKALRDALRSRQRAFSDDHPVIAAGSELLGSLPTAVAMPGAPIRSAAALGAASGLGHAEGDSFGKQAGGALLGGALGGTLAAGMQAIARPASALGGAILTRTGLRDKAAKVLPGVESSEERARGFVRHLFEQDAMPDAATAGANALKPETFYKLGAETPEMVADMGGANVRRGLAGLQGMMGKTAQTAKETLEGRTAGQFGRITESLRKILHVPRTDADRVSKELVATKRAAMKPAYDKVYQAHSAIDDPTINAALENRHFRRAYRIAKGVAADEGVKLPELYKQVGTKKIYTASGVKEIPVYERREIPNLQVLDYIKRELDGIISRGKRNVGKGGLSSTQAKAMQGLRDKFVQRLDDIAPEYGDVRKQFGDYSSLETHLEHGRNILKPAQRLTEDDVAAMSDNDREMYLIGAYRAIRDRLAGRHERQDLTKLLDTPDMMEQLQLVARKPGEFDEFMGILQSELGQAETAAAVQGSRTAPVGAMMGQIEGISPDAISAMGNMARGNVWGGTAQLARSLFTRPTMHPASTVADAAGEMLMQPATPQNMANIFQPQAASNPVMSKLAGMGIGGAVAPSLSDNATSAKMEAVQLRSAGLTDAQLAQQLSMRYTPEVVKFITAATPQRIPQ